MPKGFLKWNLRSDKLSGEFGLKGRRFARNDKQIINPS